MKLKAELHTHINIDPVDIGKIKYTAEELIDEASKQGFEVLAITCHDLVYEHSESNEYAQKRGIILISGAEMTIEGKHVLVYNITEKEREKVQNFTDLIQLKQRRPEILIIASHPFYYLSTCLKGIILQYPDLFDAWEHSFFYTKFFNPNKKLLKLAKKNNKPVVGNSDVHILEVLGSTYSMIEAEKNKEEIIKAIKKGKVEVVSKPLSLVKFMRILIKMFL